MNIGLIDVDGHNFPNFALMRASAYHKAKGDQVEWATPFNRYDKVLASKVFTFTPDFNYMTLQADIIEKGGTGYDIHKKLPFEISCSTTHGLFHLSTISFFYSVLFKRLYPEMPILSGSGKRGLHPVRPPCRPESQGRMDRSIRQQLLCKPEMERSY